MNRHHARPMAEHNRAVRVRHAASAACLVAMFAVVLAAVLLFGAEEPKSSQTEHMAPAQIDGAPRRSTEPYQMT